MESDPERIQTLRFFGLVSKARKKRRERSHGTHEGEKEVEMGEENEKCHGYHSRPKRVQASKGRKA